MKHLLLAAALFGCLTSAAETPWKPAGDRIKTRWAAEVDPAAPLPEYPRPTLVRSRWRNLNGLWNYSLTPAGAAAPGEAQGRILVPFPIESSLSGVQRGVTPQEALWYETTFEVPAAWRRGNDVLLTVDANIAAAAYEAMGCITTVPPSARPMPMWWETTMDRCKPVRRIFMLSTCSV